MIMSARDLKWCEQLHKELAMYREFRNVHGAAAVLRQLQANKSCPAS